MNRIPASILAPQGGLRQSHDCVTLKVPAQLRRHRRLTLNDVAVEPFRLFFPLAVAAGLLGVALWPLHFVGWMEMYPGTSHTRLMGQFFFGGFILGFLGTALPRMLSAPPFAPWQIITLALLYGGAALTTFAGNTFLGDALFLLMLLGFTGLILTRFARRHDVPPPGFVLVGMALLCGLAGTAIGLLGHRIELDPWWLVLRPLLAYQGFVLLPVLGVGAFILPKFLGLENTHDFPTSPRPPAGWLPKALFAFATGLAVLCSFALEADGWHRTAHAVRLLAVGIYFGREVPLQKAGWTGNSITWSLRTGLAMILLGLLVIVIWPGHRVAWLHVLFVGGTGMVTLVVATRVVFGHSGQARQLWGRNRWMWWSLGLILLGMATRISGDYLPQILVSHYNYGVLCWVAGMAIWAWKVLPKVLVPDEE